MFIIGQWNRKIRNIKISIEIVKKITVDKIYQEVYYISIGEEEREYMNMLMCFIASQLKKLQKSLSNNITYSRACLIMRILVSMKFLIIGRWVKFMNV